mgnify:CR=1 FL=1
MKRDPNLPTFLQPSYLELIQSIRKPMPPATVIMVSGKAKVKRKRVKRVPLIDPDFDTI